MLLIKSFNVQIVGKVISGSRTYIDITEQKRKKITCSICNHQFNRKDNFNTHARRFHGAIQDRQYGGKASTLSKESSKPLSKPPENSDSSEENSNHPNENEISQAINGSVTSIKIKPKNHAKFDFLVFFFFQTFRRKFKT